MYECDHHPKYKFEPCCVSSDLEKELNLQDELVWGLSYRHLKKLQENVPIPSKKSPIDIPFVICREKQRRARAAQQQKKKASAKVVKPEKRKGKSEKPTLLERSVMSQRQYMEYLAVPKQCNASKQPTMKKKKCRCNIEPCSPRVVQLALPKKLRVFNNWKDYHHFLSTPMLLKLQDILHTDKNLEPREARYYYKQLDKKRWKMEREKRRLRRKVKAAKEEGERNWLMREVKETTVALVDYIKQEPLFCLTYKQLMLSDGILEHLERCGAMQKPKRSTEDQFKKTIIEVSDKIAVWMDTLTRFVDLQAFDSAEDIPPLTISSMGEGEEGESSYYSDEDRYRGLWDEGGALYGEGEGEFGDQFGKGRSPSETERMMAALLKPHGGEGESDLDAFLDDLDLDLLDKLIRILSNCSDDFLEGMVDENVLPGVRYIDILNRVKQLRDGMLSKGRQKPFLEEVMLNWAIQNEPDEVDDKMKNKITETAALLGDFLFGRPGAGKFPAIYEEGEMGLGEEGLGEEGLGEDGLGGAGGRGMRGGLGEGGEEGGEGEGMIEEELFAKQHAGMLEQGMGEGGESGEGGEGDETLRTSQMGEGGEGLLDEDKLAALEAEGGEGGEGGLIGMTDKEKEDALLAGAYGRGEGFDEGLLGLGEEAGEVAVLYGPGLEGRIIKGHKPSVILEHRPDMVCCLSLKIWAVWLLDITHNAHNWTRWLHCLIQKVREYASIVRGDVILPDGTTRVLYKEEWRQFAKETEEMIAAWKKYSAHVRELSDNIMENFHGKKVLNCCPKCLQDHLIKDVTTAHETLNALTEAINCAAYWQKSLEEIVEQMCPLGGVDFEEQLESSSTSSEESSDLSEPCICRKRKTKRKPKKGKEEEESESSESIYEIEEINSPGPSGGPGTGPRGFGPNQGPGGSAPAAGGRCRPRY